MNPGGFYGAAAADRRNSASSNVPTTTSADAAAAPAAPSANQAYLDDIMQASAVGATAPMYAPTEGQAPPPPQQQQQQSPTTLEGNMAELLEAAAKATTESQRHAAAQQRLLLQQQQQQQQQNVGGGGGGGGAGGLRKVARNTDLRGTAMQEEEEKQAAGQKRKRVGTPDDGGGGDGAGDAEGRAGSQSPRKRARQTPQADVPDAMMGGHHGYHHHQQSPSVQQQQQAAFGGIADARAVGVHSAAALFRQPSAGSAAKKHTRPPMSKLFASLQLTPENFLRLQAAAKAYMLDEAHPERQSCVGSRGKGDTDMVKLRLFNCCRDFLSDGIGERFFGPGVPPPTENEVLEGETMPGRKWVWPRDGNKIVSLVTPLLRRMVTNERQRQYAQETRKGTGKRKDATTRESSQDASAAAATPSTPFDAHSSPQNPAIDPSLSAPPPQTPPQDQQQQQQPRAEYGPQPTQYPHFLHTQPPSSIYTTALPSNYRFHHQSPPDQNVIQVLITKNNTKLLPRIDMPSWPSTPHHTLPLADLRKAIEEEVKGLLKRGLDLGIRRRSVPAAPGGGAHQRPRSQGQDAGSVSAAAAASGNEDQGDTKMTEGEQEQQQDATNIEPGDEDHGGQSAAQKQQQAAQDEPSLEGITLEIRALTGCGFVLITNDDEWRAVLTETGKVAWMEGVLKVVVEVV